MCWGTSEHDNLPVRYGPNAAHPLTSLREVLGCLTERAKNAFSIIEQVGSIEIKLESNSVIVARLGEGVAGMGHQEECICDLLF